MTAGPARTRCGPFSPGQMNHVIHAGSPKQMLSGRRQRERKGPSRKGFGSSFWKRFGGQSRSGIWPESDNSRIRCLRTPHWPVRCFRFFIPQACDVNNVCGHRRPGPEIPVLTFVFILVVVLLSESPESSSVLWATGCTFFTASSRNLSNYWREICGLPAPPHLGSFDRLFQQKLDRSAHVSKSKGLYDGAAEAVFSKIRKDSILGIAA